MNKDYLETLFRHKITTQDELQHMEIKSVFPDDGITEPIHRVKIEDLKRQLENIEKLIDAYLFHHSDK